MSHLLKHPNKLSALYHLSDINHDGQVFYPRVPDSIMDDEDEYTPRVCFSTSISRAFVALIRPGQKAKMFVHIPRKPIADLLKEGAIYKPTNKEVPDAMITREYWLLEEVQMCCIGEIEASYHFDYMSVPRCRFKWIEKY